PYQPGRVRAYVDQVKDGLPQRIRIISETRYEGRSSPVWLHEQAQVILVMKSDQNPIKEDHDHWALDCDGDEGTLSCKVPVQEIKRQYPAAGVDSRFKVWVDEPPYYERPGLWSDTDIVTPAVPQPYAKGEWIDVRELPCSAC